MYLHIHIYLFILGRCRGLLCRRLVARAEDFRPPLAGRGRLPQGRIA